MIGPKTDAGFRKMMAGIFEGMSLVTKAAVEKPRVKTMVQDLVRLRCDFVLVTLAHYNDRSVRKAALGILNEVRNSKAAQEFLNEHPLFFTEVDRLVHKDWRARS